MARQRLLLRGARLIDGSGAPPMLDAEILISDGQILSIGPARAIRHTADIEVVDVEGRSVMPGLIDAHTHLTYHLERPDVWALEQKESVELNTFYAGRNAGWILASGVTSIGDGGCRGFIGPAVRDAVRAGLIPGPDVIAAGPIICGAAGLLDGTPAWMTQQNPTSLGMTANGPERVREVVRQQIKGRVDWIKVAASGVAGSPFSSAETDDLGADEIAAAVLEAAKYGKRVHAHAHSRNGILAAVRAGVLSIHSAEYADEACLAAMLQHGTIYSPTIAWLHVRCMERFGAPNDSEFRRQAWHAFDHSRSMIAQARAFGVPIALGSDAAHRFPHVPSAVLEMEYFEALGFTPLETIRAATSTAAAAIGRSDRGLIAAGRTADLLVVDGDPSEGVGVLRDPRCLWRVYRSGNIAQPTGARDELARRIAAVDFEPAEWLARDFSELQGIS